MPNVKQIISNHNKTILTKDSSTEDTTNNCNYRVKEKMPSKQQMPNIKTHLPSHGDMT